VAELVALVDFADFVDIAEEPEDLFYRPQPYHYIPRSP
jgi:hypothetical protein